MEKEAIIKRHAELLKSHNLGDLKLFLDPLKKLKCGGYMLYGQFYIAKEDVKDLAFLLIKLF